MYGDHMYGLTFAIFFTIVNRQSENRFGDEFDDSDNDDNCYLLNYMSG
jgi:hypothetical protein